MAVTRHFLGWDEPVARKVADFLLAGRPEPLADLSDLLILVPTRQAGRRLREAMARRCSEDGGALLSARVAPPSLLLREEAPESPLAGDLLVHGVWTRLLLTADLRKFTGLFPEAPPSQDFAWASHLAELVQALRVSLADGGYAIADVPRALQGELPEPERWGDLAELERRSLQVLQGLNLTDPLMAQMRLAEQPKIPEGVRRIVVAAVPDPSRLVLRALERLAEHVEVEVLVHAPSEAADQFDAWGRPLRDTWRAAQIDVPDPGRNLVLAASPEAQADCVWALLAAEAKRFGPADVAIGVADPEVTSSLAEVLRARGLAAFDPAGRSAARHPLLHLLQALDALATDRSFESFAAFLRQPDVLSLLRTREDLKTRDLLTELDTFQNEHLPAGLDDVLRRVHGERGAERYPLLQRAAEWTREGLQKLSNSTPADGLRAFLADLYAGRSLLPGVAEDEAFATVAALVNDALEEIASPEFERIGLDASQPVRLMLGSLARSRYYLEHEEPAIDLEGWLELPWMEAPFLLVAGMNEGRVPDGRLNDLFLPDSLRQRLGLRSDLDRLARDSYLMTALLAFRQEKGRTVFLVSKRTRDGDPLKPSRLLFRCREEDLPGRARQLFGDAQEHRSNVPHGISFRLRADLPGGVPPERLSRRKLSVTTFRRYLDCPFRYYLSDVLQMEPLDDRLTAMDSREFGSLLHGVLQDMAEREELWRCEDEARLAKALGDFAVRRVMGRYGPTPSLEVLFQLEAARQRLAAFARVQVALVQEGWEILHTERPFSGTLEGMEISGRIDRIDRHRSTGEVRVLDYKTSDRRTPPEQYHLCPPREDAAEYARCRAGGKERVWLDLQLPLYHRLGLPDIDPALLKVGYFHLPKAVSETGVGLWEEFDAGLAESAARCAVGVIRDLRAHRFWPPAQKPQFENFGPLFPVAPERCVDGEAFLRFLEALP